MLRGGVVTLIVVGLATSALADAAPEPEGPPDFLQRALELFREGAAEGDHAKLEEAIRLFKQGHELNPDPVILCNVGRAYRLLGELPRAHMMLSECVRRLPAAQPELDELEAELPEQHVAVDVVSTPAGARLGASVFADDETVGAPAVIWLPQGVHTITARLPGYADSTQEVTITAEDVAGQPRRDVKLALRAVGSAAPIVVPEPAGPSRARRNGGWIALAGGVALLAGGGVRHVGYDTRDEITYSLYGVGAAAAITGALLLYLSPGHGDRIRVEPAATGDGATVWLDLSP